MTTNQFDIEHIRDESGYDDDEDRMLEREGEEIEEEEKRSRRIFRVRVLLGVAIATCLLLLMTIQEFSVNGVPAISRCFMGIMFLIFCVKLFWLYHFAITEEDNDG